MKTVALVELNWRGHHSTYFKFFTKTLLELGYQVIALCPKPSELTDWITLNAPNYTKSLYVFQFYEEVEDNSSSEQSWLKRRLNRLIKTKPLLMTIKRWHHVATDLHTVFSKIGLTPDLVFFAYLDSYLGSHLARYVIDYIFPYKWSGLYVSPFHLRATELPTPLEGGKVKPVQRTPHSLLLSPNCLTVAVLDEGVADKLQESIGWKPVIVFPDFADMSQPDREFKVANQIREKARGRKIISLIGSLEKRKGLLKMLEVSQVLRDENYFFVFVGEFVEATFLPEEARQIKSIVDSKPNNCFFHFEWIPDEFKYNSLVEVCDVLCLLHDYPHSSNTLTKAALFEKLLLVSNNFCVGERVQKFHMGFSVNRNSTLECVDALRKLDDQSRSDNKTIQPDYETYRDIHSIEQLYFKFKTLLNLAIKDKVLADHG